MEVRRGVFICFFFSSKSTAKKDQTSTPCTSRTTKPLLGGQAGRPKCHSPPTPTPSFAAPTFPPPPSRRSYKRSPTRGANNTIQSIRPQGAPLNNSLRLLANSLQPPAICNPLSLTRHTNRLHRLTTPRTAASAEHRNFRGRSRCVSCFATSFVPANATLST